MNLQKMGKIIAEARKKHSMTQSQLGDMIGVSGKAVSKWERGISAPDISLLNDLSKILEVNVSQILTGEPTTSTSTPENINKTTLKVIGAYNQMFKKKYTKIITCLLGIIVFILVTFSVLYFITNYNRIFVYKLYCKEENLILEGLVASNQMENSLMISGLNYSYPNIGTNQEIRIKRIELTLTIDDDIIYKKGQSLDAIEINDYLRRVSISVNENKNISKLIYNNKKLEKMKLVISYIDINDEKQDLIIPIKIEKKFSNNKLFY